MRKLIICFVLIIEAHKLHAQGEGAAFTLTGMGVSTPFARDYQAIGINPANLDITPEYNKKVTLGIMEGGMSFYSQMFTKNELYQNIFKQNIATLPQSKQRELAIAYSQGKNACDIDFMPFGISIKTKKAGTFAFSSRERLDFYSKLGPIASDILWLGYNAPYFDSLVVSNDLNQIDTIVNNPNIDPSTLNIIQGIASVLNSKSLAELLQGTKLGFTWYREINLSYGKRIFKTKNTEFNLGVGFKILIGQGIIELVGENGSATAFSALSPIFDIDYKEIASQNPTSLNNSSSPLKKVGLGSGIDIGANIVIKEKLIVNASINDLGTVKWDGNVYKLKDVKLISFENAGLENVDIINQIQQLNGSDGLVDWQGSDSRVTILPSVLRFGVGYENKKLFKVGVDVMSPLSNKLANIQSVAFGVGGEIRFFHWIHLQCGYTKGGNYNEKIPAGIYFSTNSGSYEFGLASRDISTFFRANTPTVSLSFGFMRFRF